MTVLLEMVHFPTAGDCLRQGYSTWRIGQKNGFDNVDFGVDDAQVSQGWAEYASCADPDNPLLLLLRLSNSMVVSIPTGSRPKDRQPYVDYLSRTAKVVSARAA